MSNRIRVIKKTLSEAKYATHVDNDVYCLDISYLLSEYDRLREALEFYADEENYITKITTTEWEPYILIDRDGGKRARAALSHLKGEKPSE